MTNYKTEAYNKKVQLMREYSLTGDHTADEYATVFGMTKYRAMDVLIKEGIKHIDNSNYKKPTICWKCQNYRCSWMNSYTPVDGWVAHKTIFTDFYGRKSDSYCVLQCPKFIQKM